MKRIDFDLLKKCIDLCDPTIYSFNIENGQGNIRYMLYRNTYTVMAAFDRLQDLYDELIKLTAEPEYIDGWVIDGFGKVEYWTKISLHIIKEEGLKVYPTKRDLILDQLAYWNDLLDKENDIELPVHCHS